MTGVKGSRVQPAPGGTTSRCEASTMVGPAPQPRTSTRTPCAFRTTSSPQRRAVSSTKTARSVSSPLIDGMAMSSRSRLISPGKVHSQIRRLFLAAHDHGSASGSGENLQEQRIRSTPIDDVGALDASGGRTDAGLDLGAHSTSERPIRHETRKIVGVSKGDQSGRVIPIAQDSGSASQVDELLRVQGYSKRLCHGIGIHVIHLAVLSAGKTRDDGHHPRFEQSDENARIHPVDVADVAIVYPHGRSRIVDDGHRRPAVCRDQLGVHAAQSHGLHTMFAEGREKINVDLASVDELGDFECPIVGHATACHHAWLEPQTPAERGSLRPTTVHYNDPNAEG